MLLAWLMAVWEVEPGALEEALQDAGDNRPQLEEALRDAGDRRGWLAWQIVHMPHIDRLEASAQLLLSNLRASENPYGVPETLFRDYIFNHRIYEEALSPWKAFLARELAHLRGKGPGETARRVAGWLSGFGEDTTREFFGPFPDPISIYKKGKAAPAQRAVLGVAALRALGVPARLARSQTEMWPEFWDGGWRPLWEPEEPGYGVLVQRGFGWACASERYLECGWLLVEVPDSSFASFEVHGWRKGAWEPIEAIWYPREDGEEPRRGRVWSFPLPGGRYLVTWGVRNWQGNPYIRDTFVSVSPGDTARLALGVPAPPVAEIEPGQLLVHELKKFPEIKVSFRGDTQLLWELVPRPGVLVVGLPGHEATLRVLSELAGLRVLVVAPEKGDWDFPTATAPKDDLAKAFRVKLWPGVLAFNREGELLLWTEGFWPGVGQAIKKLLAP